MKVLLLVTVAAVALGDDLVDRQRDDSEYHFAWLHDGGRTYDWQGANSYCSRLGRGWKGISIESRGEDSFVSDIIDEYDLPWIWTGGQRRGRDFAWPSGARFVGLNWSHTGGRKQPQPDNREEGGENCVAVLNDFYDDGVRWHDIACHHEKSIICERSD